MRTDKAYLRAVGIAALSGTLAALAASAGATIIAAALVVICVGYCIYLIL